MVVRIAADNSTAGDQNSVLAGCPNSRCLNIVDPPHVVAEAVVVEHVVAEAVVVEHVVADNVAGAFVVAVEHAPAVGSKPSLDDTEAAAACDCQYLQRSTPTIHWKPQTASLAAIERAAADQVSQASF